ncbi:MAG TPA: outer membrane protein assembly factor BamD, partial [Blastocatellia bacterium]|nr:outer membrane protein assembly factor BamD [Blastocatellia bacterium]
MKAAKLIFIIVTISLTLVACGKPKNKVAVEQAKPGRDSELFKNGVSEIVKGHEDTGRILLQTIMNTYPDSPLVKTSKLAIADSFYLEGGSKNLAQAEAGYREFLQFFPNDPLADSVMLKIADIHM